MQIQKFCKYCGYAVLREEKYKNRKAICTYCRDKYKMVQEGEYLHKLLVRTMTAFYSWQDSTAKLESDVKWLKKTRLLKELIDEACEERLKSINDNK